MIDREDVATMRRAFLGLGSNVGDRERNLTDAIESLAGVVAVSPLYETDPVGGPAQPPYLTVVVELATVLTPRDLLGVAHRLESAAGRVRLERWGPRTLDVDVLLVGDLRVDEPDLVVPHPRMWERRFVLAPLADLAPELVSDRALAQSDGRVSVVGTLPVRLR
jgi:2-amino-4-hydroxy-6-hydroxymethyldihydropteridine diphosphokinase